MSKLLPVSLVVAVAAAVLWAQATQPAQPGDQQSKDQMAQCCQRMKQKMEQMQQRTSQMDEELDRKIRAMNEAQGDAKVTAIAEAVSTMAQQRKEMHEQGRSMMKDMCTMMDSGQGGGMICPAMGSGTRPAAGRR